MVGDEVPSQHHIKLILDLNEQLKVEALKKKYGIKATNELVRFLISKAWDELPEGEHQP